MKGQRSFLFCLTDTEDFGKRKPNKQKQKIDIRIKRILEKLDQ